MWKSTCKGFLLAGLMVVTATATPAWALDWHDPEWTGLGCPSKLSGDWIPLTDSLYAGSKIQFKANGVALSSKKNGSLLYTLTQNSKDGQFLDLIRVSENPISFPRYLKIRPYLAVHSNSEGKTIVLCKIKVFLFETKQKAHQMSYLSWDIYSTIDFLEVP
jgi:hypothetical protein